eukprot:scaffold639256_cov14-Prasinocladus_malaysianus.AAC.1
MAWHGMASLHIHAASCHSTSHLSTPHFITVTLCLLIDFPANQRYIWGHGQQHCVAEPQWESSPHKESRDIDKTHLQRMPNVSVPWCLNEEVWALRVENGALQQEREDYAEG